MADVVCTIEQLLAIAKDPAKWTDAEVMRAIRDNMADESFVNAIVLGGNDAGIPGDKYIQSLAAGIEKALPGEAFPVVSFAQAPPLELERGKDGHVLKTFGNLCRLVESDELFADRIRYNALSGRVMLYRMPWDLTPHPIRDADLYHIRKHLADTCVDWKPDDIRQALAITADKHKFHPVLEKIDGLVWDGRSRLADLFPRYLGAERSDYTTAVTKLMFYGAIQRVKTPGVKFDYCIILADTKQGTGKSTICRLMALDDDWFCDALGDLSDSKKAYEAVRGHWICELGEMLATRRTKDIESIKAYLSRTADDYRDPYGVYPERRPRQCIFIGTTNKPQFLPDDKTGNRRFIPILCDGSKADIHPMQNEQETREYVRQCYAEAMVTGAAEGWPLVLDHKYDEELSAIREQSTPEDVNIGQIQAWLDTTKEDVVCSRMIWDEVFFGRGEPSKFELQDIAEIMHTKIDGWKPYRGKTGSPKRRVGKYGAQRAWVRDVASTVATDVASTVATGADFEDIPEQLEFPFQKTG